MSATIKNEKVEFRRKVSVHEEFFTDNTLKKELDYWKNIDNKKVNKIDNILNDEPKFSTLKSPCYGDPKNRDVLSGGWIRRDLFQKHNELVKADSGELYIRGGPRFHIALDNLRVKACIMSCGGLCPGINVVIRELVMALRYNYGVAEIYGIKWGFLGFTKKECWVRLNPDDVKEIHLLGGTVLGTSRSGFDGEEIAKQLIKNNINMVFFIGGDGTHRGIKDLSKILKEKKKKIVLVGIPKSIDNDMPIIDKSFGLESAIQESVRTIRAANVEANCNLNGIGLVKLFGRSSGFVAMLSTLAARDVNICLIPEIPFNLYGENGLLDFIFQRIKIKEHCVIVVSDGARFSVKDYKTSNGKPVEDIGIVIKKEIIKKSEELGIEVNLKYMDPTYVVRAVPANEYDCNLCAKLAESAVHCAFAGFTNFSVGMINNKPCMIPLEKMCGKAERKVEFNSDDYLMLLASTGQPSFYPLNEDEENESEESKDNTDNSNTENSKSDEDKKSDSDEKGKIFNFHSSS